MGYLNLKGFKDLKISDLTFSENFHNEHIKKGLKGSNL